MDWDVVSDWMLSHGIRILVILVVSFVVYFAIRKLTPHVLHHTIRQRKRGKQAEEELEQRIVTLSRVFSFTGGVLILIVAFFMILSEFGINIGPLIAGFGVIGVAVGFGAQYLIRDIIGGVFVVAPMRGIYLWR